MNFDAFNSIDIDKKDDILEKCKAAEKNIYISPFDSVTNARSALEILSKSLLRRNNVALRENGRSIELVKLVDLCKQHKIYKNTNAADKVRDLGNKSLHSLGDATSRLHTVNEETVKVAYDSVSNLFALMADVFKEKFGRLKFNRNIIPFGDYEVVRTVKKAQNEIIFGNLNYFVKDSNNGYYYMQIFQKMSHIAGKKELSERSRLASQKITADKKRKSYLLDMHHPFMMSD